MENPRKVRKRDMSYPKTTFVFGYPRPKMEQASESETDDDNESSTKTTGSRQVSRLVPTFKL